MRALRQRAQSCLLRLHSQSICLFQAIISSLALEGGGGGCAGGGRGRPLPRPPGGPLSSQPRRPPGPSPRPRAHLGLGKDRQVSALVGISSRGPGPGWKAQGDGRSGMGCWPVARPLPSCRDLGPDQGRGLAPPGLPRAIREIEYLPVNCPSYPSNSVPIIAGCSSDFQTALAPPQLPPARPARLRPGFLATLWAPGHREGCSSTSSSLLEVLLVPPATQNTRVFSSHHHAIDARVPPGQLFQSTPVGFTSC